MYSNLFGSTSLASVGSAGAFVARLADAGTGVSAAWAQAAGTPSASMVTALASSGTQVYVAGSATGTVAFGNQTLSGGPNTQYGFLATLTDAAALPTLAPVAAAEGIALFPNPAHSTITLQLPAGLAAGPATITVLNALGQVVGTRTTLVAASTLQTTLDVADLAPGVYALRVAVGEILGTARLVVE